MAYWTRNIKSNSMAKGLTFSFLIFLFASISFLIIFFFLGIQEISIKKISTERDIEFILNTLEFIKSDLLNFIEISIPRILNSIISYEIENGIFVNDVKNTIKNAFFYSIFLDENYLIKNSSLIDYEKRINSFLNKYGFNISIFPINFDVFHYTSFKIYVNTTLMINISYKNKFISSIEKFEKNISIINFEDPFYIINSNGLATNFIKTKNFDFFVRKDVIGNGSGIAMAKTIILFDKNSILNLDNKQNYILVTNNDSEIINVINQFAGIILEKNSTIINIPHVIGNISNVLNNTYYLIKNGKAYNVENLKYALENQLCFSSSEGATFLDRLEGRNRNSNKYNLTAFDGIECFVNKEYLALSGLNVYTNKTNIDYIYFSFENPKSYKVSGFKNFYIDENHILKYQLEEIIE